jgi:hypothetical protein
MKCYIILVFFIITLKSFAQELKVGDFKSLPLDISARANPVIDANGDACAIIKVRTGLDSLRFSGDLEIRKIEKHEGEFWLWVSPMTHKLNIITEDYGNIGYELPLYATTSSVYTLDLLVSLPDKILIKESHTADISTRPKKAQVYIDNVFMGYTPVKFSTPSDTFFYEVKKNKYILSAGSAAFNDTSITIPLHLKKDPKAQRLFSTVFFGSSKLGTMLYGIKAGQNGRRGWFISVAGSLKNSKSSGLAYEPYRFGNQQTDFLTSNLDWGKLNYMTGLPSGSYFMKLKEENNSFYNHFRIKAGISQRIKDYLFLNLGLGYGTSTRYYEFELFPYTDLPQVKIPLEQTLLIKNADPLNCLLFDAGVTVRFLSQYLIEINLSPLWYKQTNDNKSHWIIESSVGIGYNF